MRKPTDMEDFEGIEDEPKEVELSEEETREQELAEIDGFFLKLASDSYNASKDYFDSNIRPVFERNIRQYNGVYDGNSKYNSPRNKFRNKSFRPKTRAAIRKHEAACQAAFFSTQGVVNVSPIDDSSEIQRASADFYSELLNLRLTAGGVFSIPWFVTLQAAYQDSMIYGSCKTKIVWDFEKDKPTVKLIRPENLLFDPASDWIDPINTSPYIIELIPMHVYEVKEKIKKSGWRNLSDAQISMGKISKTMDDTVQNARENGRTNPNDAKTPIRDYDTVWVHLNIVKREGVDFVFYTLGTHYLLTDPVEISEAFLHGLRPYVMGNSMIEAHKNYPSGIPEIVKDIQRDINDISNRRKDNVDLVLDKRIFIKRGQNVDVDSISMNVPGSVTMLNDPQRDVNIVSTPDVTSSSYREQDLLNIEMDDVVGGFNSATVQSNRSLNETVGGMSLLSQSANQVTEYQLKTFSETWVEPVLRHLLLLEQEYETDEMVMMVAGKKAGLVRKYGMEINESLLAQELMLNVNVGMGATNPATHVERFSMAMSAITRIVPQVQEMLDPIEISKEVFGKLGYKDGERFFKGQDQDPEKELLKQQIQQLQVQLAQKKSPELEAAEIMLKKAQAVKTGVEASFGAMQAASVIAQNPMTAPIGDKVMEAAGYEDIIKPGVAPDLGGASETDTNLLSGVNPQDLAAAQQESMTDEVGRSTSPLQPKTGFEGMDIGLRGGLNGISNRG